MPRPSGVDSLQVANVLELVISSLGVTAVSLSVKREEQLFIHHNYLLKAKQQLLTNVRPKGGMQFFTNPSIIIMFY